MRFINLGVIRTTDNRGDGVHIGNGADFVNHGAIVSENNGGHGVFVTGEQLAKVKQNAVDIEELLGLPSLVTLRSDVIPLLTAIKQELDNPKPSYSAVQSGYAKINEFLKGVNQSLVASGIFLALQDLAHLGQSLLQ